MPATRKTTPARTPRKDAIFGLHFDLHANDKDTQLGARITPRMVERIIEAARPDYIQYDCKGHVGFLAYPDSDISQTAGGIVKDALAIYRKVTAKHGVKLLMHFSGVWDGVACRDNPDWCALDAEGKPHTVGDQACLTDVFGDYVTERMIPQMEEIVDRYDVDGFWVDGDGWAVRPSYSRRAIAAWKERTGEDKPPTDPADPRYDDWIDLFREQFLEFVRTYMDALHDHKPELEIASNWLYSAHSPIEPTVPVDFISGDYSSHNSVNTARFYGRQMASVGLPWDLMAWAFGWFPGLNEHQYKSPTQLKQEAAAVLALGGGFQIYFSPDRHGGFDDSQIQLMKHVGDFVHPRRDCCFETSPVPQVAMLLDIDSWKKKTTRVFAPFGGEYKPMEGLLQASLEAGHSVDILANHHQPWDQAYPVIAVAEWDSLAPQTVKKLVDYARAGGSLLLTGAGTCNQFAKHLGVQHTGQPTELDNVVHVPGCETPARMKGLWQTIKPKKGRGGAKVLAHRTPGYDRKVDPTPAVTLTKIGKGQIAAVWGPLASEHHRMHTPGSRELVKLILGKLYQPIAQLVDAPPVVDLSLREKDGRLLIQLNNTAQMATSTSPRQPGYFFPDYIPPTPKLTLRVELANKPRRVTLQPAGKKLRTRYADGVLEVTVPPIEIHQAVAIEW